jgi:hypothetical protein
MGNLSPELAGPIQLELARTVEQLPGPHGMPGGYRYELKCRATAWSSPRSSPTSRPLSKRS